MRDTIVHKFIAAGNSCADSYGYVTANSLLNKFNAEIMIRPLLVEGMLMSAKNEHGETDGSKKNPWLILIDEESFKTNEEAIIAESSNKPLDKDLRETIAHEVGHILSFDRHHGKLKEKPNRSSARQSDRIEKYEAETDDLYPYFLLSENKLEAYFSDRNNPPSLTEIIGLVNFSAVTNKTFIHRLKLMNKTPKSDCLNYKGCINFAVGLCSQGEDGTAEFDSNEVFYSFKNNILPQSIESLIKSNDTKSLVKEFSKKTINEKDGIRNIGPTKITLTNKRKSEESYILSRQLISGASKHELLWALTSIS
ncbi:hypothetical protein [Cerasicoccus frondis]|uniref:hypothetical protein n=1 Tax=Cerasicoccus frondis TaxID=490090 RepID=UPI002852A0D6|nr:hypothetical protein [Cerasicoccus frondis]